MTDCDFVALEKGHPTWPRPAFNLLRVAIGVVGVLLVSAFGWVVSQHFAQAPDKGQPNEEGNEEGSSFSVSPGLPLHLQFGQFGGGPDPKPDPVVVGATEKRLPEREAFQKELKEADANCKKVKKELKDAKKELKEAEAKVEKAKKELEKAQKELEKAKATGTKDLIKQAQQMFDMAVKGAYSAQAGVDSAQAGVDSAQAGVDFAQARVNHALVLVGECIQRQANRNREPAAASKAAEFPWKSDATATKYIQELLATPVQRVTFKRALPEDGRSEMEELHVFKLESTLQNDEQRTSSVMVVPPHTRGAWQAIIEAFEPGRSSQHFLIIGSPGIGKSRTINYAIREIIHERRQHSSQPLPTIVFEHRKDGVVWKFAPRDASNHASDYEACSVSVADFVEGREQALHDTDNVYIVDSGQAQGSKMPALLPAKTVFVCSPDDRHFSEWRKHIQATVYIPLWTCEAMEAAQPFLFPDVDLPTLRERVAVVGPYPSRVVSQPEFDYFKIDIDRAIASKASAISGVLVHGAGLVDADNSEKKPLSAVFGFDVVPGSNYTKPTVRFVSDYARSRISLTTFKRIYYAIVSSTDPERNSELGRIFEIFVFKLLHAGWNISMTVLSKHSQLGKVVTHSVKPGSGELEWIAAGQGLRARLYSKMKAMPLVEDGGSEPIFFGSNFPVIDAADARNHGYSVTVAQTKQIEISTLKSLRQALDLREQLLHIVFLVPEGYTPPRLSPEELYNLPDVRFYVAEVPSPLVQAKQWKAVFVTRPILARRDT